MSKKSIFVLALTIVMLLGSQCIVSAGSMEVFEEVANGACMAYYDAYCLDRYGTATTCVYVDNTISSVVTYVDMDMYVVEEEYIGLTEAELDEVKFLWGTDSDYSEAIYIGRASADVEISISGGLRGAKVISHHSVYLEDLNYTSRNTLNVTH